MKVAILFNDFDLNYCIPLYYTGCSNITSSFLNKINSMVRIRKSLLIFYSVGISLKFFLPSFWKCNQVDDTPNVYILSQLFSGVCHTFTSTVVVMFLIPNLVIFYIFFVTSHLCKPPKGPKNWRPTFVKILPS